MNTLNILEADLLLWVQNHFRTGVLNPLMHYASEINNSGMLAIGMVLVLLIWKRYRSVGITACTSLASEFLLVNVLIKQIVARPRPYVVNEALVVLGSVPTDYSFPSGHTASVFAVATVMLLCMPKRYGIPAVVISALIALSRLYNAAHYPTDVLTGMLIGSATGILAVKLVYKRFRDKKLAGEDSGGID